MKAFGRYRVTSGVGGYLCPIESATVCQHALFSSLLLCRSQWPRGLRRRSAAARLLGLWVRIPAGAWMSVVIVNFETS